MPVVPKAKASAMVYLHQFDRLVQYFEHRTGWHRRVSFLIKTAFVAAFLYVVYQLQTYAWVLRIATATVMAYFCLAVTFYIRDRPSPRRAPGLRLRYLFMRGIGDCLICHEDAKNPVLLSCGHLYCAGCIMPCIEMKIAKCSYCLQVPATADNLRLERTQIAQLALDMVLVLYFGPKLYITGWRLAPLEPICIPTCLAAFHLCEHVVSRLRNGVNWWKQVVTLHEDPDGRRERKERQREDLKWTEELRNQFEDGLSWIFLMHHWLVAAGWQAAAEDWQRRKDAEDACACGCATC